jgi:hypothetical protein
MSTKREPLKEQDILDVCERYADNYPIEGRITVNSRSMRLAVEPLVEAARAKDAELIQQLFDCLHAVANLADVDADERSTVARPGLEAAYAAGFKPSEQ